MMLNKVTMQSIHRVTLLLNQASKLQGMWDMVNAIIARPTGPMGSFLIQDADDDAIVAAGIGPVNKNINCSSSSSSDPALLDNVIVDNVTLGVAEIMGLLAGRRNSDKSYRSQTGFA